MTTALIIIYGCIALGAGYTFARWTYNDDPATASLPPRSVVAALFIWVVYGLSWPVLVIGFALYNAWDALGGDRFGDWLFRRP